MKRVSLILIAILLLQISVIAQQQYSTRSKRASFHYEAAIKQYRLLQYNEAVETLKLAIGEDPNFVEAWLLLGQVHNDAGRLDESVEAYKKAVEINPLFFPIAMFNLAYNEYLTGKYEDAKTHVNEFLASGKASEDMKKSALKLHEFIEFSIKAVSNPVPFMPVNLGENINSEFDEYWPSLSADELMMVFTALVPIDISNPKIYMNRQEDFYYSNFENGEWQPAKNAGRPLNTLNNEGAQSISANGRFMFYTACNRPEGKGRCDIYMSERRGEQWSEPVNLGAPVNSAYNEKQPSVSADGRTLYFISDRQGTKGSYDIWVSSYSGEGNWSEPLNLGDSINTAQYESSPFIHPDNKTLYFSSDGWPGLGRSDIFMSHKKDSDQWSTPENIGYPINTQYNEEGLIVNTAGDVAYFSSDRLEGKGRDIFKFNLYSSVRPIRVSYMKGKVYDAETGQRLEATFELIDLQSGKTVTISSSEPRTGEFLVCIPSESDYALNVNKKGYLFYSGHFEMRQVYEREMPFLMDVPLQPVKVGESIVLRNVFYAFDSYELVEQSRIELDKVVLLMRENPAMSIEIGGHTDNTGTLEYNQQLSEKRAGSVKNYLVSKGIAADRIIGSGYGETKPVASNDTDEGRATNRRTEMKVIKN